MSVLVKMALHWVPVYHPIQSISQHLSEAFQGELMRRDKAPALPFRHQHEPTCDTSSRRFTPVIFNALFCSPFTDGPWAKAANVAKLLAMTKDKNSLESSLRGVWDRSGVKEITVTQRHVQGDARKPLELPMATDANTHTSAINIQYDS